MSDFEAETVTIDRPYGPKVTLTRDTSGTLTATLEAEGLSPERLVTSEETGVGIVSLDPVQVYAADAVDRSETIVRLVDAARRAMFAAVRSTRGSALTGPEMSAIAFRVSLVLRKALREMDEDA